MRLGLYVLSEIGGEPISVSLDQWARDSHDGWHIDKTEIHDALVSTVFLGMDHRHNGEGPPVLWETMVFGGPLDEHQWRYTSRDDAVAGHAKTVAEVEAATVKAEAS